MQALGRKLFLTGLALASASETVAGPYAYPAFGWAVLAPRPTLEEATPNYYGYGAALSLGYSMKQVIDLGAYANYLPASRKDARIGAEQASFLTYGGEVALRVADSVYVSLRGGTATYRLIAPDPALTTELVGAWGGPFGGIGIGAVSRLGRQTMLQTTIELMHTIVEPEDSVRSGASGTRRLDSFGLSFGLMLSSDQRSSVEDTIFKDFLDTLNFF